MTYSEYPVLQQHRASVVFGLGLSSLIINVVGCCTFEFIPFAPRCSDLCWGSLAGLLGVMICEPCEMGPWMPQGIQQRNLAKPLACWPCFYPWFHWRFRH